MEALEDIMGLDLPEMEKLGKAFEWVTGQVMEHARQDIELARAMGDHEALIKGQIKLSTMKYAQEIFQFCYQRVRAGSGESHG